METQAGASYKVAESVACRLPRAGSLAELAAVRVRCTTVGEGDAEAAALRHFHSTYRAHWGARVLPAE